MWEPKFTGQSGKPYAGTTWVSCQMAFTELPAVGDDIEMYAGQTVGVAERVHKLDGTIDLYIDSLGGWDRDSVIELFEGHPGYVITTHNG
jgi:hypothetical protein